MKSRRLVTLVTIPAAFLCSSVAAQAPPPEAFAALPAMESPSISPDGQRLAFIAQTDKGSFVILSNIEKMTATGVVDVSASKPREVGWTNNDTLLLLSSETITMLGRQVESVAPFGVDLSGELHVRQLLLEGQRLTSQGGGAGVIGGYRFVQGAQLIGFRRSTGEVLFPRFNAEANRVLYAVDAKNDSRRELDNGTKSTRDWVVDDHGEPVFRVEYTEKNDYFAILRRTEGRWVTVAKETTEIPELALHGLDAAGQLIIGMRLKDVGRRGLYVMSAETGAVERPLYVHDSLDVSNVRIDPYTNRVVGAEVVGDSPVWFDTDLVQHQAALDDVFRGESPRIVSWSEDRSRFVVSTDRADHVPAFYFYDSKRSIAKQIASANMALDRVKLAPRTAYHYKARDGVDIPGYLTRPLGASGPTPLVVLPHGGPAVRDVGGYDWLAHFLASRGYAVLQPNFRGSSGYGEAWEKAGHGEWGIGVMQHDLSDGVAALVSAGIADPDRVCIVGGSYGGYAALAGAVFTPELYRCAVAIAGVADLRAMLTFSRGRAGASSATVAYWRLAMGVDDTGSSNERLKAASPAEYAESAKAPVLLIHGRDDTVVPIEQSRIMERALRSAGKDVQLVELEGEDHWLSRASTRLETLRTLDAFLAQHLGD